MRIVNRRRNVEAAHSGVMEFNPTTAKESRQRFEADRTAGGQELLHMLQHIAEIEQRMLAESHLLITEAERERRNTLISLIRSKLKPTSLAERYVYQRAAAAFEQNGSFLM